MLSLERSLFSFASMEFSILSEHQLHFKILNGVNKALNTAS